MTNRQFIKIVLLLLFPYFLWSQSSQKIIQTDSYEDLKQAFINSQGNDKKQLHYANAYIKKAQIQKSNINLSRGYFFILIFNEESLCSKNVKKYLRIGKIQSYDT